MQTMVLMNHPTRQIRAKSAKENFNRISKRSHRSDQGAIEFIENVLIFSTLQSLIKDPREANQKSHEELMHQKPQRKSDSVENDDRIGSFSFSVRSDIWSSSDSQKREKLLKVRPVRNSSALTLESSVDEFRGDWETTALCNVQLPGRSDSGYTSIRLGIPCTVNREDERERNRGKSVGRLGGKIQRGERSQNLERYSPTSLDSTK